MRGSIKRIGAVWACAAAIAASAGVSAAAQRFTFGVNETESLPNWAFITDHKSRSPQRGDLVDFVAPDNRYYPPGARFVKVIYGVPGDSIERRGLDVFIDGRFIGRAKTHSKEGYPTHLGASGVIPPGRFYVGTPHPDGFDSRYAEVGLIPMSRIVGIARPIL